MNVLLLALIFLSNFESWGKYINKRNHCKHMPSSLISRLASSRTSLHCTSEIPEGKLNYPTFSIQLGSSQSFTRTVTNVGEAALYYTVKIVVPQGVSVSVQPAKLQFTKLNEKTSYSVRFSRSGNVTGSFSQGYLQCVSTKYSVTSVVSVKFI